MFLFVGIAINGEKPRSLFVTAFFVLLECTLLCTCKASQRCSRCPKSTFVLLEFFFNKSCSTSTILFPAGLFLGKPRRGMLRRAVFSDYQRKGLEKRFQVQKYISKPDRKKLAEKLGLKDSQVSWNKRLISTYTTYVVHVVH